MDHTDEDDDPAIDDWRMCDELSVEEAALLACGMNPSKFRGAERHTAMSSRYNVMIHALSYAVSGRRLPAKFHRNEDGEETEATILVADLRTWFKSRGIYTDFFSSSGEGPEYLSPSHPHYSPKLAAAIKAWEAMQNPELRRGRTIKQGLEIWLRAKASEFGLTKEDGSTNSLGIEEVAKIANWETKGGAPRTLARNNTATLNGTD